MALAPLMILGVIRFVLPRFEGSGPKRETDTIDERENPVLIVGVGRFGQMVARILRSTGYRVTVLDYDADQVDLLRKFGLHAFYGDASRPELLESAGIAQARVLVLALDQPEKTTEIIEWVRAHHPKVRIFARVFDRVHAYEVIHRGVDHVYIETAGSALNLARDALEGLGMRRKQAHRLTQLFWKTNERAIRETARMYHEADEATLIRHTKGWLEQLEKTLQSDLASGGRGAVDDRGWESAPRPDIKQ
jgi:voltage-gated potassium channel Kch